METMGELLKTRYRTYDEQCIKCITRKNLDNIRFQPGTAVKITLPGRENHRETKMAWVEENYKNHILLRVDTPKGSYKLGVNKVDIAQGEVKIKEVN